MRAAMWLVLSTQAAVVDASQAAHDSERQQRTNERHNNRMQCSSLTDGAIERVERDRRGIEVISAWCEQAVVPPCMTVGRVGGGGKEVCEAH